MVGARVRLQLPVAHQCFDAAGNETAGSFDRRLTVNKQTVYRISNTANELFVLGCNTLAYAGRGSRSNATSNGYFSGCVAYCNKAQEARSNKCDSIGCCHGDISPLLTNTRMSFRKWSKAPVDMRRPCSYAFIVEKKNYSFRAAHLSRIPDPAKPWSMPLWLDWAIRDGSNSPSCPVPDKTPGYACVSSRSKCVKSINGNGYTVLPANAGKAMKATHTLSMDAQISTSANNKIYASASVPTRMDLSSARAHKGTKATPSKKMVVSSP
ncbi:hypothetical protein ZWY2020_052632 [Hordeum vulgare]|nr:hypothetical protein ZWY2020_052632 [Hordeum vulgare]